MRKDYAEPLDLEALAQVACLSPAQFVAVFRRETSTTPMEFLRQIRIAASQPLLRRGLGVTEAALAVGFTTLRSFQRTFLTQVGTTPSAYRASFRAPR